MKMKMPKVPDPPAPPPVVRVPQTDDPDVAAAIRKKMMETFTAKRGRSAADLTSGNGSTGAYSRESLG